MVLTKLIESMFSYAAIWVASDICQQKAISRKPEIDYNRTFRTCAVGCVVIGPLIFGWFRLAEFLFPGRAAIAVFKKVVTGQILFVPVGINSFYIASNIVEGKQNVLSEAKAKFLPTYMTGLAFWPIVQSVNFSFIPHDRKVIFTGCASFLWTNYLCYMKEKIFIGTRQSLIMAFVLPRSEMTVRLDLAAILDTVNSERGRTNAIIRDCQVLMST